MKSKILKFFKDEIEGFQYLLSLNKCPNCGSRLDKIVDIRQNIELKCSVCNYKLTYKN